MLRSLRELAEQHPAVVLFVTPQRYGASASSVAESGDGKGHRSNKKRVKNYLHFAVLFCVLLALVIASH
jgi:hypothetical protein